MWSTKKKERNYKRKDDIKPCDCGFNRWKTVVKDHEWSCRKCGKIRKED